MIQIYNEKKLIDLNNFYNPMKLPGLKRNKLFQTDNNIPLPTNLSKSANTLPSPILDWNVSSFLFLKNVLVDDCVMPSVFFRPKDRMLTLSKICCINMGIFIYSETLMKEARKNMNGRADLGAKNIFR